MAVKHAAVHSVSLGSRIGLNYGHINMTYLRRPYLDNDRASIEHSRFIKQPKSRLAASDAARKLRDILVAVGGLFWTFGYQSASEN